MENNVSCCRLGITVASKPKCQTCPWLDLLR
ncbi:hypothetical protein [Neorhodopirellula lusitana]